MSDLKQQANIVKQNLYYHFADSSGNWIIPDDMKFLNEVLNDIMKLCDLANGVSDEPQIASVCPDCKGTGYIDHPELGHRVSEVCHCNK